MLDDMRQLLLRVLRFPCQDLARAQDGEDRPGWDMVCAHVDDIDLGQTGETPADVTRAKPVDVTLPTPAVEDERSHFDRRWRRR